MNKNGSPNILDLKNELVRILYEQHALLLEMDKSGLVPKQTQETLLLDDVELTKKKNILQNELFKLQNFDVVVSVVGTMKAGKSTLINAMVGQELLPNHNRPMTSVPTLICHKKGQLNPVLRMSVDNLNQLVQMLQRIGIPKTKELDQETNRESKFTKFIISGNTFQPETIGREAIADTLAILNDLVRALVEIQEDQLQEIDKPIIQTFYDDFKNVDQLPRIEVEFATLREESESEGRLMLLDTPGPNEAKQPQLKRIMKEQLERSSAVLLVLDYTQLQSEASNEVQEELQEIPTIDQDRLYVVVNKFDQKKSNTDDEETTKDLVVARYLKGQVKRDHIFPASAQRAYYAQTLKVYLDLDQYEKIPPYSEAWVKPIAELLCGEGAEDEWDELTLSMVHKRIERSLVRSCISEVVMQVITEAYRNAPQIAIESALKNSSNVINDLSNLFNIQGYFVKEMQNTEKGLEKIKAKSEELKKRQQELNTLCEKKQKEMHAYAEEQEKEVKQMLESLSIQMSDVINDLFEKKSEEDEKPEEDEKSEGKIKVSNWFNKVSRKIKETAHYGLERVRGKTSEEAHARVEEARNRREERAKELEKRQKTLGLSQDQSSYIFKDKEDLESFVDNEIQNWFDALIAEAKDGTNMILLASRDNISIKLREFEKIYKSQVEAIRDSFDEMGIQVRIKLPNMTEIEAQNFEYEFSKDDFIDESQSPYKRKKEGFWNWSKRLFNLDGGYEIVSETKYVLSIDKLKQQLEDIFNSIISQKLLAQASHKIVMFGEVTVRRYNKEISQITQALVNELNREIQQEESPTKDLEARKNKIRELIVQNESIKEAFSTVENAKNHLLQTSVVSNH